MSDAEKEVESAEEGEITDDEEPVVEEPSHDQQENAEEAVEDDNYGGRPEDVYDGGDRLQDEGGEENEEDAEAEAARRARRERKKAKKDKDRKRHRDRDRDRELDSDEEKKRRLKKKLAALEMQMQEEGDEDVDDEAMGIYVNGGSPSGFGRQRRRRRPAVGASGSESPSDGAGSDGERSPERKRKKSRERRRERRAADKRRRPEKSGELCQLFMMGKCPKSPERCIFSHDAQPPQIFELCKFYLFDRCAKKEKCLYLHKGFPCKYFHTGHRCMDTAESCKFSHEPLVEETRNILLKHLEAAPKEILGDFPRMSRDQALNLVCKTECENKGWTSHPLMEQQNRQAQQPQPPPLQQQPPNPFGGPQVGDFANPPRPGGFDQPGGGFPPRAAPRDPFAPPAGPGGFGRDDFGPPQTPGLLGAAPSQAATASIQERLVQLSGGVMNDASGRPPPQPLMGVAPGGGGMAVDAAPVGGSGGERRRKSRWENQEQLPLPPPSLLQHPGATFRPPLINQPFNNPQQHMGPAAGPPPQQQPHPLPPQSHRPIGIRPVDPGFNVFDQVDQRNGRKDPAQPMGTPNEDDPEDGDAAGQRTPPNTEPNPFGGDESDPFNPASEDAESPPPSNTGNSANSAPSGMPKAQQRLYERIQEKQLREKSGSPSPHRDEDAKRKPRMNEGWYSSDEENNSKPEERTASSSKSSVSLPKELSDVISSLRKSPGKSPGQQQQQQDAQEGQRGSRDPRKRDPRRDPRRNSAAKHAGGGDHSSSSEAAERERDKRILEMDLGSVFGDLDLPIDNNPSSSSAAFDPAENDMGLPFKPHVVASVAKEIDASIYSHSPLLYRLRAIAVAKPDYSDLVTKQRLTPAQSQDPRLRRYAPQAASNSDGESMNHGYNPGQDLGRTKRRDPRRRD